MIVVDLLSDRTKETLNRTAVRQEDDLYPDRTATPDSDGNYPLSDADATTLRLNEDEVPRTTKDMSEYFKWEHGDVLYGSFAKKVARKHKYVKDINKKYGKEDDYNSNAILIDTLSDKGVGEQLKKYKRR